METNKILSADLLDIIFDDRNKEYGAYDLRKTYERRIKKSLFVTGGIILLTFSGVALAGNISSNATQEREKMVVQTISPIEDEPVPPPEEKPKPIEQEQVRTEKLINIKVVPNDQADPDPPPTQDDLKTSVISNVSTPGIDGTDIATPGDIDGKSDIIEPPKPKEPEIWSGPVEIEAKFQGSWEKFLTRNLRAEVPIENGAAPGRYQVLVQFVVSLDGTISEIKPLTAHGHGMEEEAMRVIRKADKWSPAVQNGRNVKAYRRQPITFVVSDEN